MNEGASGWKAWIEGWGNRLVRDREVILRTDGQVKYFTVSRRAQWIVVGCWVGATMWTGLASAGFFLQWSIIDNKQVAIERSQESYRQLLDQMADYQVSVVNITRDLKETQAHLSRLFDVNTLLKNDLNSTEAALRLTQGERDRINAGRRALNDQLELLGRELRRMTAKNNALEGHIGSIRTHLETVRAEKAEIAAERAALNDRMWRLNNDLEDSLARREQLEAGIERLRADVRNLMIERSAIAADNDTLRAKVASLEVRMEETAQQHRTKLEAISDRTLSNIQMVETILKRTGLQLEDIAPMPEGTMMGQGGPFIPYHPDMRSIAEPEDALHLDLDMLLERWEQLRGVLVSVPLIAPLDDYRLTSGFGRRKDPINGRWSRHDGVDMAAGYKSPVLATAPGEVVFAGRRSRYGRTVEVDHGNGIMTRYAHLAKVSVKRGQKVELGDTIGLLGNSGRSTGPHVHYEVRYNGKALNPQKFLKATRYVQ